jgi:uracil-DNA glycosylase
MSIARQGFDIEAMDRELGGGLLPGTLTHVLRKDSDWAAREWLREQFRFSNANTIILMGRTRHNGRMGRALAITKHRGSAHGDEIRPYRITEKGLVFD